MSTREKQNENLLVKLVKKSVGLPIAGSSCCGAPKLDESVQPPAAKQESSGCGCEQEAQVESETA